MPRSHGWTLFHGLGDTAEIVPVLPFAWPTAPVTTGNATSWAKGVSGLWSGAGRWTDKVPNARSTVTIAASPVKGSSSYTVTIATAAKAADVTLSAAAATLVDNNSLTIGTLLNITAGQFDVEGRLSGGVVDVAAGASFYGNGTLTGLTFEGSATSDGSLTIGAGVVFAGAGGTGSATIDGPVTLLGSQTLNDVTIDLTGRTPGLSSDDILVARNSTSPVVLTIGAGVTINDSDTNVAGLLGADQAGDAIVNQGTINVTSFGTFVIDATHFTNDGAINVSSDGTLLLTGTPSAGSLATLVESVAADGGTAYVAADVVGGVLDLNFVSAGATLSGVAYEGSLTALALENGISGSSNWLTIGAGTGFAGLNGVGAATINVENTNLVFDPGAALYNADVALGTIPSGPNLSLELAGLTTNGTSTDAENLVIGANSTIDAKGGYIGTIGPDDTITNYGTIELATAGAVLAIDAVSFVNDATITVGAGTDLIVTAASLGGTLSAAQAQALIGSVTNDGGAVSLAGTVTAGTLDASITQVSAQIGALLSDVAFQGSIDIAGGTLEFGSGTTFAGAGGVGQAEIAVNGGQLVWGDGTALSNAVVTLAGSGADGAELSGGLMMVIGATASVNITGNDAHIIASGALVVDGAVNAAASATDVYIDFSGSSIAINGSLALAGNDVLVAGGNVANSGSISIAGGSSVDMSYGLTNSVGSTISLSAAAGVVSAIDGGGLLINSGSIVSSGAGTAALSDTSNVGIENSGTMTVSSGVMQFGSAVLNQGTIGSSGGTLQFLSYVTNSDTITAAGGTATFDQYVYGTGALDISGGGTLSLEEGAVATQSVGFLDATGVVDLTVPQNFLGTISGFAAGDKIVLEKTQETGFNFSGGVLTVSDGTSNVASLHFNGAYSNSSFSVQGNLQAGTVTITHT